MSAVINLLNAPGANPNYQSNGNPLLKIAVEMGHAQIISVLITAGANPNNVRFTVQSGSFSYQRDIAHYIAHNDFATGIEPDPLNPRFPWAQAARMLYAFGNAVDIANVNFNWNRLERDRDNFSPRLAIEHLSYRHQGVSNSPAVPARDKPIVLAMAAHLKKQGAQCRSKFIFASGTLCNYAGPTCPAGGREYDCGQCNGYPHRNSDGNGCLAECQVGFNEDSFYEERQCLPVTPDVLLLAEIQGVVHPDLVSIAALLDAGPTPT